MSCNIDIDLKLNIHDAALIRAAKTNKIVTSFLLNEQ